MRFEERELKPYAEPVSAGALREGEVYFSAQFADEGMIIPIMETWVFVGRNLDPEDADGDRLYFQDVESYGQGIRYNSAESDNATFQTSSERSINHFFEYEQALDQLMKCSLRRRKLAK
jgi:hypothetical protein